MRASAMCFGVALLVSAVPGTVDAESEKPKPSTTAASKKSRIIALEVLELLTQKVLPVEMDVPVGATVDGTIVEIEGGGFGLAVGNTLLTIEKQRSIVISAGATLIEESPERLLWSGPTNKDAFHVFHLRNIEGLSVKCSSLRDLPDDAAIAAVDAACRSLRSRSAK